MILEIQNLALPSVGSVRIREISLGPDSTGLGESKDSQFRQKYARRTASYLEN